MHTDRSREWSILAFLVLLGLLLGTSTPGFFSLQNASDILVNISFLAIAAAGVMMVILTGQIDISIGSILGACAIAGGLLAKQELPMPVVFAAMVGLGVLAGAVNGALVAFLNIPSIIVTLGTMTVIRGAIIILMEGNWVTGIPEYFQSIGTGHWLGIANPIWSMLAVLLVTGLVLRHSRWGRSLYAVGSNAAAARLSGIPVRATVFSVFCVQGALIGLAAFVFATRFSTIQPNTGTNFELLAITAVVVGGTSILGGAGNLLGTVLGCLLLGFTSTALTYLHVSSYWEQAVQGLFILLAVSVNLRRARPQRKPKGARHAYA